MDGTTSEEKPRSKARWRRKRCLISIVVVVVLIIIGVIVGAVVGSRKNEKRDTETLEQSQEAELINAASASPFDTKSGSGSSTVNPSLITITTTSTQAPSGFSTSPPSSTPSPLLEPTGAVPRTLGAASGSPFSLLVWDLQGDGKLWRREYAGDWQEYTTGRFLVAPVVVTTSETSQAAFSVDAVSGHVVVMRFRDGAWEHDEWEELGTEGMQFLTRPTVVSRAEGKIDVFGIDSEGKAWTISHDGEAWGDWKELGDGFSGEVSATTAEEGRVDIFATKEGGIWHLNWEADAGWAGNWEDLGAIPSSVSGLDRTSSPMALSWRGPDGETTVDVVVNAGSTYHKRFLDGTWSDWLIVWASHEGYEFPDTQSAVQDNGEEGQPFAHLISRGTDDCIHYNRFNGTDWGSWDFLWCIKERVSDYPTEFWPTAAVLGEEGELNVIARNAKGELMRYVVPGTIKWDGVPEEVEWELLGKGG